VGIRPWPLALLRRRTQILTKRGSRAEAAGHNPCAPCRVSAARRANATSSALMLMIDAPRFRSSKRSDRQEALARVRQWTRQRFNLPEDAAIVVAEVACGIPGCPPLETVVAFWTVDATRHQFKIFKPVALVTIDDLPFAWQRGALAAAAAADCDCC
jgi:hypothetical protein